MRRRRLLAAAATACGLAGCLAGRDGAGAPPEDSMNGSDPTPTVEDRAIERTGSDCAGDDVDAASVERADGRVTVTGSLQTPTPCYLPEIVGVGVDGRELRVQVDATEEDGICQQCLGEVRYEARIDVSNAGALDGAVVEHVDGDDHRVDWSGE